MAKTKGVMTKAKTIDVRSMVRNAQLKKLESSVMVVSTYVHSVNGPPWSARVDASCELSRNLPPMPSIKVKVDMFGETMTSVCELGAELLHEEWPSMLDHAASLCVEWMKGRDVVVPDRFQEGIVERLHEARKAAIAIVVRCQASILIQHISSEEAFRIWACEEVSFVMGS